MERNGFLISGWCPLRRPQLRLELDEQLGAALVKPAVVREPGEVLAACDQGPRTLPNAILQAPDLPLRIRKRKPRRRLLLAEVVERVTPLGDERVGRRVSCKTVGNELAIPAPGIEPGVIVVRVLRPSSSCSHRGTPGACL